jgi:hypothetical protein
MLGPLQRGLQIFLHTRHLVFDGHNVNNQGAKRVVEKGKETHELPTHNKQPIVFPLPLHSFCPRHTPQMVSPSILHTRRP